MEDFFPNELAAGYACRVAAVHLERGAHAADAYAMAKEAYALYEHAMAHAQMDARAQVGRGHHHTPHHGGHRGGHHGGHGAAAATHMRLPSGGRHHHPIKHPLGGSGGDSKGGGGGGGGDTGDQPSGGGGMQLYRPPQPTWAQVREAERELSLFDATQALAGHVGHHGGGGGGGGHHHHGGFGGGTVILDGGGWGYPWPPSYYQPPPVVLACAPGQLLLADGTCFDPRHYGQDGGKVAVGAPLHEVQGDFCPADGDGIVMLPDGTRIGGIEWGPLMHGVQVGASMPNEGEPSSGTFPPFTGNTPMPASGASGTATSGNPEADALNLQWVALEQVIPSCLGPNAVMDPQYTSGLASQSSYTWQATDSGWREYYAGIGSFGTEDITGTLSGWQDYANAWGATVRAHCPNIQLPPNFPTGTPTALPTLDSLLPSAASVTSLLEWGVIAVALGVGLWLFWPVLVGAKGAIAAAV